MGALGRFRKALAIPALVIAALFCLYLGLFHGWLAGGPPNPNPEWHRTWSNRFFITGLVLGASAAILRWKRRRRRAPRVTPPASQSPKGTA